MAASEQSLAQEMMSAAIDHQLSASEAAEFAELLANSPEINAEYHDLKRVIELVGTLPTMEVSSDFYEKLARKMRRRRIRTYVQPSWISLSLQVLSILVVLMVAAIYLFLQIERDPKTTLERPPSMQENSPSTSEAEQNFR